jgi:hypothetical protein
MESLNDRLPGDPISALAPTLQQAHSRHDNAHAMTAPGSVPAGHEPHARSACQRRRPEDR